MLHDGRSVPLSPSKGKAREETRWRTGWWDFVPLVEKSQRPLVWSEASVILSAHPARLEVTGRHFASSKQFSVPPPVVVGASPSLYDPPTFISLAPGDKFLFVFYPGRSTEGIGCIWRRGPRLDTWVTPESWKFAMATYPVAAEWLGCPRTWHVDGSGSATRLPFRGPRTPVSSPTLLYITSDHRANLCYLRYYITSLKIISCSLDQKSIISELSQLDHNTISTSRECTSAAIGLGFEDASIMIATRLRNLPTPRSNALTLEVSIDTPELDGTRSDWEIWGEEELIHLCELRLEFDGVFMSLHTNPLRPIQYHYHNLTKLLLVPCSRSANVRSSANLKSTFYMISGHLDFGDYTSTPNSEVIVHTLSKSTNEDADSISWNVAQLAVRDFHPEVLCFLSSFVTDAGNVLLYVGTMKTSGSIPRSNKSTKVDVGSVKVLRISDLKDDDDWGFSAISSTIDRLGRELPHTAAISPNGVLVTTVSQLVHHASVHSLPRRKSSTEPSIPYNAVTLASAVFLGRSTSDIANVLSSPSVPMNEVASTLHCTAQLLDKEENGMSYSQIGQFMGIVIEVYKTRIQRHISDDERGLELRAQTLLDILSLKAFNEAFEDCQDEGDHVDLQSIWQLIGLSEFIVHFTENLMRECVLWSNPMMKDRQSLHQAFDAPKLLPLAHPYAYENICKAVHSVAKLREYVGSLPAGGEKEGTAKKFLVDLVDSSGIDFPALDALLVGCASELTNLNADDCRMSLALSQPVPSMYPSLFNIIKKIDDSTILNKSKLFLKPTDLIDGVQQLSIGTERKVPEVDVVFKKPLAKQTSASVCLRCGGLSTLGSDLFNSDISIKWRMWEKMQMPRCICYGHCMKAD
ncbi:hypothetical protein APHAL10511_001114 [Amanita phalloides]|nr:hypothetical protein APHAL10511_001114 [Amanita phalloides]